MEQGDLPANVGSNEGLGVTGAPHPFAILISFGEATPCCCEEVLPNLPLEVF